MSTLPMLSSVRLEADERLDKPDLDAIQDLIASHVATQIGAAFGWGGGLVTTPTVTFDLSGSTKYLNFGGFSYYISEPSLTEEDPTGTFPESVKALWGQFFTVRPSDGGQVSTVDFTAQYDFAAIHYGDPTLISLYPYLYVQPYTVDARADARVKWAGTGTPTTILTRKEVRHRFKFSTNPPQVEIGWAPVLQIQWNSIPVSFGAPYARMISAFDNPDAQDVTQDALVSATPASAVWPGGRTTVTNLLDAKQSGAAVADTNFDGNASKFKDVGLIQLLQVMRSRKYRDLSDDLDRNWYQQLAGDDASTAAGFKALIDKVDEMYAAPYIGVAALIVYDGSAYTVQAGAYASAGVVSVAVVSAGRARVVLSPVPSSGTVASAHAGYVDAQGNIQVTPSPFVPSAPTSFIVTMWNESGTLTHSSFFFTAMYKRA